MTLRGWLALGVVVVTFATLVEMAATSTDYGYPRTTIMVAALGLLGIAGGWILGTELRARSRRR